MLHACTIRGYDNYGDNKYHLTYWHKPGTLPQQLLIFCPCPALAYHSAQSPLGSVSHTRPVAPVEMGGGADDNHCGASLREANVDVRSSKFPVYAMLMGEC